MSTDEELLAGWAEGDNTAGEALFSRYFEVLCRFFRNKAPAVMDDLIQETLLACVKYRQRVAQALSFRAYLLGTARHVLFEHYRSRVDDGTSIPDSRMVDLAPSVSQVVAARAEQRLLLRALQSIPLRFQLVLELFYWEDLTAAELAKVVELPEGTVRGRIARGRALLAVRLAELEDDPQVLESVTGDLQHWAESVRGNPAELRDP